MPTAIDTALDAMTIATMLLNLGFALLVGALLTCWQLGTLVSDWSRQRHRQLRWLMFCSGAAVLLAMVAVLMLEAAIMTEASIGDAVVALPSILQTSYFGHAWLAGAGCIVLVLVLLQSRATTTWQRDGVSTAVSAVLLITFAVSRSLVSHAVVAGAVSWQVAIDTAHLVLISVWLGEVVIAAVIMLRQSCGPAADDRRDCRRYIGQLSASATAALFGIVVTGAINSWRGLGTPHDLIDSVWGLILLAKMAGVAIAVALGAINRWSAMPDLLLHLQSTSQASVPVQRRFALALQIESVVLMVVLFAAAMLSGSAPPASL